MALLAAAACGDDDSSGADPDLCEIGTELEQLDDFTAASSPDEAREIAGQFRELLAEAEDVAPDEISAAIKLTAESTRQGVLDFYEDADFDVDPAEFDAALESGEVGVDPPEAQDVFDWLDENCAS